jgi:hypothetical protein
MQKGTTPPHAANLSALWSEFLSNQNVFISRVGFSRANRRAFCRIDLVCGGTNRQMNTQPQGLDSTNSNEGNPHASPLSEETQQAVESQGNLNELRPRGDAMQGCWRDGGFIVAFREFGKLPAKCVFNGSGQIREQYFQRFGGKAHVSIAYGEEYCCQRSRRTMQSICMGLFAMAPFFVLAAMIKSGGDKPPLELPHSVEIAVIIHFFLFSLLSVILFRSIKRIRFVQVGGEMVWLKGGGQEFLRELPIWEPQKATDEPS